MALSPVNCGAVILAGGQSRRMGQCKALLDVGGETLISRLARQLTAFDELLISTNDEAVAAGVPGQMVRDIYPGLGPLAGLHAALSASGKDCIFCVSCDMPCFTAQAAATMLEHFQQGMDAMVCVDSTGRVHPLCGIYAKTALPAVERQLRDGRLRMRDLLEDLQAARFSTSGRFSDNVLANVNTPEALARVLEPQEGEDVRER